MDGANAQISAPQANTSVAAMYAPRGPMPVSQRADSAEPRIDAATKSVVFQA